MAFSVATALMIEDAILACEIQIAALEEDLRPLDARMTEEEFVEAEVFDEWRRLQACLADARHHLRNFLLFGLLEEPTITRDGL